MSAEGSESLLSAARRSTRREVIGVLDQLQDELKRRYKEDPSLSLR